MAHWDSDSEETPPWSIEEQNRLAREIDNEAVNIALDLWFKGHSSQTSKTFDEFYEEDMTKAQRQLFLKRRANYKRPPDVPIIK